MNKFCDKCEKLLRPKTLTTGDFYFECTCGNKVEPRPEDSLLYERNFESNDSNQKYEVYLKTAHDDVAAYRVTKKCDKCESPIMILVRTGDNERTFYRCIMCENIVRV